MRILWTYRKLDRVPSNVLEWAMRKNGIPEVFVGSVMCLYERAETRVRVDSELSEEFEVDVVTALAIEGVLSELLYTEDLVLMSETFKGLGNKLLKLVEAFESKGFNGSLGETDVMVSGGITKDGMSKGKADPCGVCSLRVNDNSALCLQCVKWLHCRCAGVKRVNPKCSRNFTCRKCEGNIREVVEQEEKLCDEVETVMEFTYLSGRVRML